jgi:hypothetical protein
MQKSPPSFGVGNVASVHASINAAALKADSNDNGDAEDDDEYLMDVKEDGGGRGPGEGEMRVMVKGGGWWTRRS